MRSHLRCAVVASGTLQTAHNKGEIRRRYWNPANLFDEVHVITLAERDIDPAQVGEVAGRARLFIHPIGLSPTPFNLWELRERTHRLMAQIRPHIIRGHSDLLQGYLAVWSAQHLGVPSYISLHSDAGFYRGLFDYGPGYARSLAYRVAHRLLGWRAYTLRYADAIVPKYLTAGRTIPQKYQRKTRVIYNSVLPEVFPRLHPVLHPGEPLRIISVGRQFQGKDPTPLIWALVGLRATLTLVGDGPLRWSLIQAAERAGVAGRVRFIDRVPNTRLSPLLQAHHLFAINISSSGVCIPVLEAMASGLPIVINRSRWEPVREVCGQTGCAWEVDGSPESYRRTFQYFIDHPEEISEMGELSHRAFRPYRGDLMEEQEKQLILSLMDLYE